MKRTGRGSHISSASSEEDRKRVILHHCKASVASGDDHFMVVSPDIK
jgi:hypothetical protein